MGFLVSVPGMGRAWEGKKSTFSKIAQKCAPGQFRVLNRLEVVSSHVDAGKRGKIWFEEKSPKRPKSLKTPKSRFWRVRISALFGSFGLKISPEAKAEEGRRQHKFELLKGLHGRGRTSPKSRFCVLWVEAHGF